MKAKGYVVTRRVAGGEWEMVAFCQRWKDAMCILVSFPGCVTGRISKATVSVELEHVSERG